MVELSVPEARNNGGAGWWGDWYEHYRRAVFFLDQLPPGTKFTCGMWSLPVRGPPFNTAAALLMFLSGRGMAQVTWNPSLFALRADLHR